MKTATLDPKPVLTTPQAHRLLGITRQTLYQWIQTGRIKPWMKVGGASYLFERKAIVRLKGLRYQRETANK